MTFEQTIILDQDSVIVISSHVMEIAVEVLGGERLVVFLSPPEHGTAQRLRRLTAYPQQRYLRAAAAEPRRAALFSPQTKLVRLRPPGRCSG